jgi:Bacterial Ig-like domain (group 1)
MNLTKRIIGLVLLAVLAACGGGGGNPGTTSGTGSSTTSTTTSTSTAPTAASFVFSLDKTSINNGGTDKAVLTVTVLDASRNVVSGVPVSVSVDSGLYTAVTTTTGATGEASGSIAIGGNKTNRTITATITVGSLTGTAAVAVIGSRITVAALPATPAPGTSVQVTARATDANGVGISGATIQFGGTLGLTQAATTNAAGDAVVTLAAAPAVAGTYTVTASGLGATGTQDVQVVVAGGGGGGIPVAVGVISSASLQINPSNVFANAAGATANRATLQAAFQDASNQAIRNVRVRFEIVPPGLGSGEQISTGATTVYSDANGNAISAYIPGTRASPTNGVVIRICYGLDDASIAGGLCPSSVTRTMTVGGQALSVTLGFNNELTKANNNLTYIQRFVALVTDSNGNPVANAVLAGSVDITHYGKGYAYNDPYVVNGSILITPPDTSTPGITTNLLPVQNSAVAPANNGYRVWCPNEDTNRNGFLDAGEDINGNGRLDSRKADVVLSFSGSNVTAADGTLQLQVQYPQNVATWLSFTVKVSTGVAGSEGTVEKSFFTSYIEGDQVNGSFRTPPHGVGTCQQPN